MRRRGRAAVLAALLSASTASAGPWVPGPGHGYAKLWLRWLPGVGYHAGDGSTTSYGAYHEVTASAYAEVGVARALAGTFHLPVVQVFRLADPRSGTASTHVSPGDPAFGLRWRVVQAGRFVLSVEGSARAPLARSAPVQTVFAATPGNVALGALRVGSGVWDFSTGFSFGYGWDRVYAAGSAAHVHRTGGFDGVLAFSVESGARLSERWSARLRLVRWHALQNGYAPRAESPSGIGNGTSYAAFALEADWRASKRWLVGGTLEGGIGGVRRQTGGPVLSAYGALVF